jgi:acyl-CoA synthetase (AMP-forming)/AMP-acid ligase II
MARGANIVVCMMNHPMIYSVFGGVFRTGATVIPVMFMLAAPELRYVVADSNAQGVITDAVNLEKVREAINGMNQVKWIAVLGGQGDPEASPPEYRLEALLENEPRNILPNIDGSDVAVMLYTFGTTGKPKGVMLTHDNFYAQGQASLNAGELESWEGPYISLSAMPMAHIFGVGVMVAGAITPKRLVEEGAYGVQLAWFDPERFMQLIQQHGCTIMPAVPTMLSLILNHPSLGDYDLTSLQEVVCGASPLPEEVARQFMDAFGCRVREIYGLTESTGLGSANRRSKPYKPGSAGLAYHNTELKIFDSEDNKQPARELGEIVLRGPAVMKGYHNRLEETAQALRSGWLHTGDIGYLDEEGYLFVVDRVKDLIIRGGENIYPAEIEDIIYKFSGIAETAVVGVPDPVYGENVVAFAVAGPGVELREQEIIDHVKQHTSSFKTPSKIYVVDALPKSPIGKILRRELRDKASQMNS